MTAKHWPRDARLVDDGGTTARKAIRQKLDRWAESTWPERRVRNAAQKLGGGRPALICSDDEQIFHHGIQRITADGTACDRQTRHEALDPSAPEVVMARLMGEMMATEHKFFRVLATQHESWWCREIVGMTQSQKAEHMGLKFKAYEQRLVRGRAWLLENWPDRICLRKL